MIAKARVHVSNYILSDEQIDDAMSHIHAALADKMYRILEKMELEKRDSHHAFDETMVTGSIAIVSVDEYRRLKQLGDERVVVEPWFDYWVKSAKGIAGDEWKSYAINEITRKRRFKELYDVSGKSFTIQEGIASNWELYVEAIMKGYVVKDE